MRICFFTNLPLLNEQFSNNMPILFFYEHKQSLLLLYPAQSVYSAMTVAVISVLMYSKFTVVVFSISVNSTMAVGVISVHNSFY